MAHPGYLRALKWSIRVKPRSQAMRTVHYFMYGKYPLTDDKPGNIGVNPDGSRCCTREMLIYR